MRLLSTFIALLFALAACSSASAIVIAEESFDYPNDTTVVEGLTGGIGWVAPWSDGDGDFAGRVSNDDVSLSLASFPFTPIGDRLVGSGSGEAIRIYDGGIDLSQDGQVIYASMLISRQLDGGTGGDNIELDLGNDGGGTIRYGIGSDEAFFLGSSAVTSAGDGIFATLNQPYFAILKVTSNAGLEGDDLLQMAFYGPGDAVPASEPVTWNLTNDANINSNAVLNSVRLVTGANTMGAAFDEIRVGYAWGSVTDPNFTPGDFDGTNGLDPNDYTILRNNMFSGTTYAQGDYDGSGLTDLRDFIFFREAWNSFGTGAFPGSEVVPEPASIALLVLGGLIGGFAYRRRRQREVVQS